MALSMILYNNYLYNVKRGRGRPHPLYTNRSYPTFSPTLVQLNIALYSALRRPMSLKLKILWWFCSISRPPTALLCFVFYTWSSVTLHAPGLMNCLVSLFIIIKAQAWKTHYLILSNLAIFFLTFLMPCFFASLFISDGFL